MYGVPPDLDLQPFVGARLINIGLGLSNTLCTFEVDVLQYAEINTEARWEAIDRSGRRVDTAAPHPPDSLELGLTGDVRLRFYDDSDELESMTITPGDYVI